MKRYDTLDDMLAFKRGCDLKPATLTYRLDVRPAAHAHTYDQELPDNGRSTKY